MSIETVETPPAVVANPIKEPPVTGMAQAAIAKFFSTETTQPEEKVEPVVEKKVEPIIEKKIDPVQTKQPVAEKTKSKTAQEIENLKSEYQSKITEATTQRDELKAKAFDLENELNSLREKASSTADYAEIKQKNAELEKTITMLDIQQLPQFKQKYTAQEQYIFEQVKGVLDGVENGDKIMAALKLSPGPDREAKLDELKQDLGITKVSKLAAYEARLDELGKNRQLEIDNSHISRRLYQEEQDAMAAQQKKKQDQIFQKHVQYVTENDPTYKKREGDEAFNQNVESRLNEARRLFYEATPEERSQAMLAAVDRPILMSLVKKLSEELESAKTALNGKLQATPGVGATRKDEPTKPSTFMESIKQSISS